MLVSAPLMSEMINSPTYFWINSIKSLVSNHMKWRQLSGRVDVNSNDCQLMKQTELQR
jgi:hypothetical protein